MSPQSKPSPGTPRRRRRLLLIGLGSVVVCDQLVRVFLLGSGTLLGVRVAPFDPPLFCAVQYDDFARLRAEVRDGAVSDRSVRFDAEIGWDNAAGHGIDADHIDELGARATARRHERVKPSGVLRILALGCSFTYGTEVEAKDAWPAQLEQALGEAYEVINYGVPGYGIDQAFLRWRRDGRGLGADEVWLGFMPEASARNVNMFRPVLRPWSPTVAFKPRFSLDKDGTLRLIPCPADSLARLVELIGDQRAFVRAIGTEDYFVARLAAAYEPLGSHWTHWFATSRILLTLMNARGRDAHRLLADTDGEVHRVTRAIPIAMAREVAATGCRFRLLVLPDREGLLRRGQDGRSSWDAVATAWRDAGIEVLDVSSAMQTAGASTHAEFWAPGGHYSAQANRIVAASLAPSVTR